MRSEVQESIMKRAFRKNQTPFVQDGQSFSWSGTTKVTSKSSGIGYRLEINLSLVTTPRLSNQIAACLLKPEGVRMEDLMVAEMIDPKLHGSIDIKGLPNEKFETNLAKFIKKLSKPTE